LNVLITGGAGFIGSHTCDALIRKGHRVRILDNLQRTVHPKGIPGYLNPEAELLVGDVRDKAVWIAALKEVDAVYHLAAYQDYLTDFSTFFYVNSVSTALLYETLVQDDRYRRVCKVIVAASQAVMGEGRYRCPACDGRNPADIYPQIRLESQLSKGCWEHICPQCGEPVQWMPSDETVSNPCNPYALSKYSQEQIALQLGKRYDIPTVVLRYSIVQGPRQSFYNAYSGIMRIFSLSLMMDRAPVIFEDGNQIRDYVNIDDVVDANLRVLEKTEADHQVFNVGGGKAWTVSEFYEILQRVVGKWIEPQVPGFYRYGDTRHIFSDTAKLRSLGWKPKRGIEQSIQSYWTFIKGADATGDILDAAADKMRRLQVIRKRR